MAASTPKRNGHERRPGPASLPVSTGLQPGVERSKGHSAVSTASHAGPEAAQAAGDISATPDTRLKPGANGHSNDWLLWQLVDSAFPTGGFAHSGGLEAAWQHGEVRTRAELGSFLSAALEQISHSQVPFVTAVHDAPATFNATDRLCDAFTTNHVANRASRSQGRALLTAAERIFGLNGCEDLETTVKPPFAHLAPTFGYVTGRLGIARETGVEMFVFSHLRSLLAAAVRLNITGPMEAQMLQFRLGESAATACRRGLTLGLDDVAQTAPLLEVWQGAQDRLYSRLFQS